MNDPQVLREVVHFELQRRNTRSYSHNLDDGESSELLIDRTSNTAVDFLSALKKLISFTPGVIHIVTSVPKPPQGQEKKEDVTIVEYESNESQAAPNVSNDRQAAEDTAPKSAEPENSDSKWTQKTTNSPTEIKMGSHRVSQATSFISGGSQQPKPFGADFFTQPIGSSAAADEDDENDEEDEDEDKDGDEDEDEDEWEDVDDEQDQSEGGGIEGDDEEDKDDNVVDPIAGDEEQTQANKTENLTLLGIMTLQEIRPIIPLAPRRRLIPAPTPTPTILPIRENQNLSFSGLVGVQDIRPSEPQEAVATPSLSISEVTVINDIEPIAEQRPELTMSETTVLNDIEPVVQEEPNLTMSDIVVLNDIEPIIQQEPQLSFSDTIVIHDIVPIVPAEKPTASVYTSTSQGTQTDPSMFDIPDPPTSVPPAPELTMVGPTTLAEIVPTPQVEPALPPMSRWTYSRILLYALVKVAGKSWLCYNFVAVMALAALFTYTELTW